MERQIWKYLGQVIFPAGRNASGIRWNCSMKVGAILKTDTKKEMKSLIRENLKKNQYGR